MKKLNVLILLTFWTSVLLANDPIKIQPPISHVTVYLKGAQITRQGSISLNPGKNTIQLEGLPPQINPQSIQVKLTESILIESVLHDIDYLQTMKVNKSISQLATEKIQLIDSIYLLNSYKHVFIEEKKMILANNSIKGQAGLDIEVLSKASSFYRQRLQDIENNIFRNNLKVRLLKKRLYKVSQMLFDGQIQSEVPVSIITIIVSTKKAIEVPIEVKYTITDAGWEPNYDVRVKETNHPLTIDYKARVFQSSGEDWKDVNLTLSTGNPFINHNKPQLNPYALSFNNYYSNTSQNQGHRPNRSFRISGKVTDQTNEPLIGATILEKGTTNGTVTDLSGLYHLELSSNQSTIIISYTGFSHKEVAINYQRNIHSKLIESAALLDDVSIRASITSATVFMKDGKRVKKRAPKKIIPISIEKSQTTTQFEIQIPYSIPSDNEAYNVAMVQYEVPAQYLFTAVPKLSTKAYLTAQFTDWNQYRFLNGDVHLFLKGVYQGDTYLDLQTVEDTLSLSIGIDEDIFIERKSIQDYTRTKFIGSNKRVRRIWQTIIKNNKPNPVRIIIEDQYPISVTNSIKVNLEEMSGAKNNESTGNLQWDLKIKGNTATELILQYSVKYPKKHPLVIE